MATREVRGGGSPGFVQALGRLEAGSQWVGGRSSALGDQVGARGGAGPRAILGVSPPTCIVMGGSATDGVLVGKREADDPTPRVDNVQAPRSGPAALCAYRAKSSVRGLGGVGGGQTRWEALKPAGA